jgi:hypothetical protein
MLRRSTLALMALLLGLGVSAPRAAALELILVRHADKDSQRGDYNLSPAGFRRALDLARLIPACFGVPTGITTYVLDPLTSKNARSYQSAVPLAIATGATIRIAMESAEASEQVGRQLRLQRTNASERLVLFWEHRRMPDLARGLGWSAMVPIADDDFDQLFVFRYAGSSSVPQVRTYRQSQLVQLPCFRQARLPWDPVGPLPSSRRMP